MIDIVGKVCNVESADLCLTSKTHNMYNYTPLNEKMSSVYCIVYRPLLNITCLKSSKIFMNGKGVDGQLAQVNTIYKTRDMSQ